MTPKKDLQQGSHPDSTRYLFRRLLFLTRGEVIDAEVEAGLSRLDLARVRFEDELSQIQQQSMNPRRGTTTARLTPMVPAKSIPQK